MIASYDAKLLVVETVIKASEAEVNRLRSENMALAEAERVRSVLWDEVAVLKSECALLPCLQAEVEGLKIENEASKKKAVVDAERDVLKIAALKELSTAYAEKVRAELTRW